MKVPSQVHDQQSTYREKCAPSSPPPPNCFYRTSVCTHPSTFLGNDSSHSNNKKYLRKQFHYLFLVNNIFPTGKGCLSNCWFRPRLRLCFPFLLILLMNNNYFPFGGGQEGMFFQAQQVSIMSSNVDFASCNVAQRQIVNEWWRVGVCNTMFGSRVCFAQNILNIQQNLYI